MPALPGPPFSFFGGVTSGGGDARYLLREGGGTCFEVELWGNRRIGV
jgi:hypothetical protein